MTFEEYIKAVIDYCVMGGVDWEQSYWRILQDKRPDLSELVERTQMNPTAPYVSLGDFLHLIFCNWGAKP